MLLKKLTKQRKANAVAKDNIKKIARKLLVSFLLSPEYFIPKRKKKQQQQ